MATCCLSTHARYRCAHSGACCSDVWAVPVEPQVLELLRSDELFLAGAGPFVVRSERPEAFPTEWVAAHHDGWCAFFERDSGLCTLQRQRGEHALPSSCRHFPRVHLIDGRGTLLSLSHFCPTAARMLLDDVPLAIVEAVAPLALDGPVEGLNAVDALPPLVRPGLLADLEGYAAWERAGIDTLARADLTYAEALDVVAHATEGVRRWRPLDGPLSARVVREFDSADGTMSLDGGTDAWRLDLIDEAVPASLEKLTRADAAADLLPFDGAVKRYLAARLFGTWLAYRTRGLRSIVEGLRICLALLRNQFALAATGRGAGDLEDAFVAAVRETDRMLLHVVHLYLLASRLEIVERA